MLVTIPVSLGELVDKITILEIKAAAITDAAKLANVQHELRILSQLLDTLLSLSDAGRMASLRDQLREVNQKLWNLEDDIRDCERDKQFDQHFIELARKVYQTNDNRAQLKKEINVLFGSEVVEEKSYASY